MMFAINRVVDVDHAAEVLFRVIVMTLLNRGISQFVQGRSNARMYWTKNSLLNRERLLKQSRCLIETVFEYERARQHRQVSCRCRIVLAIPGLDDIQSLPLEWFGFLITAAIVSDGRKIDQNVRHSGMTPTVKLTIHREQLLIERFGGVIVSGVEMTVR